MPANNPSAPLQASSFAMEANPDAIVGVQANETFMLTANGNGALGTGGETTGFAKYKFDNDKFTELNRQVIAKEGRDEPLKRARNGLDGELKKVQKIEELTALPNRNPEQQGELNHLLEQAPGLPQLIQDKLNAAVAALKRQLPADQREGVDAYANDSQAVIAKIDAVRAAVVVEVEMLKKSFAGMTTIANTAGNLYGGEEPPADRALLARTVASYQVDQLLGTNSIAEEKFGVDAEGKPIGVSIQADGAGITGKFRGEDGIKKDCLLQVDLTDPAIQRGLADLEAVDYLTGQIDRHCGNIFVDPETKKVTGIDNDLAFPEISREQMFEADGEFTGKAVTGMPRQMHVETAQKILNLDPAELRAQLEGMKCPAGVSPLSPNAINSLCDRLVNLQQELQNPESSIKIVKEFNKETYLEAMDAQDQAFKAVSGAEITDVGIGVDNDGVAAQLKALDTCPKTSYLGAAAAQTKRYEIGIKEEPERFDVRPATNVEKAARSPAVVEKQVADLQREMAALQTKLDGYQERQEKLIKPGALEKLKALTHGGVDKAKQMFTRKEENVAGQLKEKTAQLDKVLQGAPAAIKDGLYEQTGRPKPGMDYLKQPAPLPPGMDYLNHDAPQAPQQKKESVGDALRKKPAAAQRSVYGPAVEGENNVGSKIPKRQSPTIGSTSSSSVRHN